jgi:F-type H+-transporting ATPase subunit delta
MNPSLQGYTAAVLEDEERAGTLPRLASELGSVDDLFGHSVALRSALTDTAVPARARRAVLEDLLEGKVSEGARRAVGYAGSAVPAPEVPSAVSWLAHRAHQAAEGQGMPEPPLGHQDARERIGGYAAAVFEGLATAELEEIEDELFRFARTVDSTPALRSALVDRELPLRVRQGVVEDLLASKVRPATLRLLDFVLAGGRTRDLVGSLYWLVEETAKARGWRVARVMAAAEVPADEQSRLADSLSRLTGQPVELQVTLDPSLLAGVVVRVGDLQVDASARGRIEELREHMAAGTWRDAGLSGAGRHGPEGHEQEGHQSEPWDEDESEGAG